MAINQLEKITINGSKQWILVRGKSINAPLILQVQAGPGFPMIPEANAMEKRLHLEDNYLVAYWDQRGCGKSFDNNADSHAINFAQLTDDVIACAKCLLRQYRKEKVTLIGYSVGATLSLMAAAKDKSLFERLVLVGLDIDVPTANQSVLEFLKEKATGNRSLSEQVISLTKAPVTTAKMFQLRAKLLTNFGGLKTGSSYFQLLIETISNMLLSKAYRLNDVPKTIKGMEFCQNALLPELNVLNLFDEIKSVEVPVHFMQGKLDVVAPYSIAKKYYEYLQVEEKSFTCFEHSAHMPHYEEPKKFSTRLKELMN